MTTAEQRVKELGLDLPPPPGTAGKYVAGVQTGTLLFLSGCGPRRADGSYVLGKLGADLDAAQGYEAAWASSCWRAFASSLVRATRSSEPMSWRRRASVARPATRAAS